ncbi:Cardiolipin synthase (CMP-forming), partial [Fasciolopsis buskii]
NQTRILTIPNVITTTRIACSPILANLILAENLTHAVMLATVVGLSDLLDGAIARSFPNQQSVLGSYLDPMADKILVTTLVTSMAYTDLLPGSLASLIICRDLGIVILAGYLSFLSIPKPRTFRDLVILKRLPIEMKASSLSKLNTFCQLSGIVSGLVAPLIGMGHSTYLYAIWSVAATTTICSGLDYLRQYPQWKRRALKRSFESKKQT